MVISRTSADSGREQGRLSEDQAEVMPFLPWGPLLGASLMLAVTSPETQQLVLNGPEATLCFDF